MNLINNCRLITLPGFSDHRGKLNFVQSCEHVPFSIARFFFLYGSAVSCIRGQHAHKELEQFIICLSGKILITLDDGHEKQSLLLDSPQQGLHVPAMTWVELEILDSQTVCGVLASAIYDEKDYHRDYTEFLKAVTERKQS